MASGTRIGWENTAGYAPASARPEVAPAEAPNTASLQERLAQAIERGAQHLLSLQAEEGYWIGELEADTTLESDYIYYLNVLGRAEPERIAKLANYVRQRQLADGGWNIYFGGPSDLNATVKAYFALKIAGDSIDAPHMWLREKERSRDGRTGMDEFVRAIQYGAGRSVGLGHDSGDSSGTDVVPELVQLQYLRNVVVDARIFGADVDSVRD